MWRSRRSTRLKPYRRVAERYQKRGANMAAMGNIAAMLM